MRVCPEPGCPELVKQGRCATHRRAHEQQRGSRQARGYGTDHTAERSRWAPLVATGHVKCWRCLEPLDPNAWTLGHCDVDRTKYHGPECPPCDYATAGRTGCPHPSHN